MALLDCPFLLRGRDYDLHVDAAGWQWRGLTAEGLPLQLDDLPLLDLPMENAALAIQAFALLDLPWDAGLIATALRATRVTGRLDRREITWRGKRLQLMLDVGHNPHAASYLAERLGQGEQPVERLAVFSLLADKDLPGVLAPLQSQVSHWYVATLDSPRARPAEELESALLAGGASVENAGTVAAALAQAADKAVDGAQILLFGSFFCVAEGAAMAASAQWAWGRVDGGAGQRA